MTENNPKNILIGYQNIKDLLNCYDVRVNRPNSIKLFHEAMTHRSYLNKKKIKKEKTLSQHCVKLQSKSNERLQFLGDSIIHLIIGDFLYNKYKKEKEGFLTQVRCKLENRDTLFFLAKQCGIDKYILTSKNIELIHKRNNVNINSRGFEAFIGALYLNYNINIVSTYLLKIINRELNINKIIEEELNYKDLIQQFYISQGWGFPQYKVLKESGQDHAKIFNIGLYLNEKLVGKGTGI